MIIGCTGNYRKEEFYTTLQKVHEILSKEDIEFIISSDLKKSSAFIVPSNYRTMDFTLMVKKCDVLQH